jgi:predicted DNA-binding protein with PD1-like motif
MLKSSQAAIGRTFVVTFSDGDDFFWELTKFCMENELRQGFIPMFIAGFAHADLVGTCEKLENPLAPVWSKVHLQNVEALGGGTIARPPDGNGVAPHIHLTAGLKEMSALGHTSHLLGAEVRFLTEMIVIEITSPVMNRVPDPGLFDVPLLHLEDGN